jgi:hypothetical protein
MAKLVKRLSDGVIFEVSDDFRLGNEFVEIKPEEKRKEVRDDVTPASSKIKTTK